MLPISGQYFPLQLAAILEVQRLLDGTKPDLILAASGGAAVATLAYGSDFKYDLILENSRSINAGSFYKPAVNKFVISSMLQMFILGHKVVTSPTVMELGIKFFKSNLERENSAVSEEPRIYPELIVGAFCSTNQTHELFSTSKADRSIIPNEYVHHYMGTDARWEEMTMSIIASSAVPAIVPRIKVFRNENKMYVDAGVGAPSPLSPLREVLFSNYSLPKFRIIYFMATIEESVSSYTLLKPIYDMINSSSNREVSELIDRFKSAAGAVNMNTYSTFEPAIEEYNNNNKVLMIIKPIHGKIYSFPMFEFTGERLRRLASSFRSFLIEVYTPLSA